MTAKKGLLALLAVLVGLLAATGAVWAFPSDYSDMPPKLYLRKETPTGLGKLQVPHVQGFTWYYYNFGEGTWGIAQGSGADTYPAVDMVSANKVIVLRNFKSSRPVEVVLRSYTNPDTRGTPLTLKPRMYPIKNDAGDVVGWDIRFKLEKPHRQHYISGYMSWKERKAHESYGDVGFQAHLKTY